MQNPINPLAASIGTGWTVKSLRFGRFTLTDLHILDTKGAQHFREFIECADQITKRRRKAAHLTRYLEELSPTEGPRLLSEEAADYLADMKRAKLVYSSWKQQAYHFRLLTLACGDISVARITSTHIREFWDIMRWWPSDTATSKKYRGLTDEQILAMGKASNRAPRADATLNMAKIQLTAFFNALLRRKVITTSPMVAFRKSKRSLMKKAKTRREFRAEEIAKFFSAENYSTWAMKAPHNWWIPMIGLYTGARVGEISQLKVSDIVEDCRRWCFAIQITADEDGQVSQSAKGESSIRTVPVAQPLIDAGFLDFLEDAKAGGHPRLFPQLKQGEPDADGIPSPATYGQMFSRLFASRLRSLMTIEKGLAFHCFRHTFATALSTAGIEPWIIASMTGHAPKKEGGSDQFFPVLQQHYIHVAPAVLRPLQAQALAAFKPGIDLPKYERGQFEAFLGPKGKKHP